MKNPIVILTGPTASGKTAISLELAKKFPVEIIAADSMTVYRGMDIGTDKPGITHNAKHKTQKNEALLIEGIPHHLIDIINPDEEFNAAIFQREIGRLADEIHGRGNIPLLVGGSIMFIDAFAYGYEMPQVGPDEKLRGKLAQKSTEELFAELVTLDPDAEWTVDRHNKRRVIRALEVTLKTGVPFTHQKSKSDLPENICYLACTKNRAELYESINQRVDEMMKLGFLDEVKKLFVKYDHNTAMQAAGYKQLSKYLEGELTLDEAIEKTRQAHRNYAKRQLTWLNRNPDVIWVKNAKDATQKIQPFLES